MSNANCPYCQGGESLAAFAYKIADFSECSTLYLFREQSHPGRVVVAYKGHVSEMVDLTPDQLQAFMADVARAGRLVHALFKPDKVNYGAYGDLNPHLHFHLVPKYKDQFEWGGIFNLNPQAVMLSDEACEERARLFRAAMANVQ